MPLTQLILLKVPTIFLGVIIVAVALTISVVGLLIVRRHVDIERLKKHHDIADPIFSTLGAVYAVLMAFVVIIAWQDYDKTNAGVEKEANTYADLYWDTAGLGEPFKSQARDAINNYLKSTIDEEWKLMGQGGRSERTRMLWNQVWNLYSSYHPHTETEKIFFTESVKKLNNASELRRERFVNAETGVHPILWFVLLAGGFITIVFTFFFGSNNFGAQILMTTLLSTVIALILFTILVLDFPFTGDVSVGPDAFREVLIHMTSS